MRTRAIIIANILVSALVTTGCKQQTESPEPIRPVLGTVEPRFRTDLGFRVQGRLIARPVNIGDSVVQGQTVAAIDSTALELAVRSARAELSKSQAQLANAEATEERQRRLSTSDATTKQRLDDAVQARAAA